MPISIISSTYYDIMNVYRLSDTVDSYNISTQDYILTYEDEACALSQKTLDTSNKETVEEIVNQHKLFCSPTLTILAGDKIVVTKLNGTTQTVYAGEPMPYQTHQEIMVRRGDWS